MAVVFQYGSNMSVRRINSKDRLGGAAKLIGAGRTVEPYELAFTVWSRTNNCAAADLIPTDAGRSIHGVLYDIPDCLLSRDTAKERRSLDPIEGEGGNYNRKHIEVVKPDGQKFMVLTYVLRNRKLGLKTSLAYVRHILCGLKEHDLPEDYFRYVLSRIIENNSELLPSLPQWDRLYSWCSKAS
jgi:AIG2-like family